MFVVGSRVHSLEPRHDGTHRREHLQQKFILLRIKTMSAHAATQVPASCHTQGKCMCKQQVDWEGHSSKTCVCLYDRVCPCVWTGPCTMDKHLGGLRRGRRKSCCLCRISAVRSSYAWNVCVTVCGWIAGGDHSNFQLHLKQTAPLKKVQVVHQLLCFLLKSSHTHLHKQHAESVKPVSMQGFLSVYSIPVENLV